MARTILQKSGGKIDGTPRDNYRDFPAPVTEGSLHVVIVITHDPVTPTLNGTDSVSYVALADHVSTNGTGDRHLRAFYRKNCPAGVPIISDNAGATMAVYSVEYSGLPEDVLTDPFLAEAFQDGSAILNPSVSIDPDSPAVLLGAFGDWNNGGFSLAAGAAYTEEDDAIANRGTFLESRLDAPSGPQAVDFVISPDPVTAWSMLALAFANGESEGGTTAAPTTPAPTTPAPTTPAPTTPAPTTSAPTTAAPTTAAPTTEPPPPQAVRGLVNSGSAGKSPLRGGLVH